jgi:4-hydroxybenzoate polyprenyltransferase
LKSTDRLSANDPLPLDTIYACQDKKDDVKAGIGSTALFFGDYVQVGLIFFGAVFVSMLAVVGVMNGQGPAYFVLTVGGTALHIIWQLSTVDLDSPASCWGRSSMNFRSCLYSDFASSTEIFNRNGDLGWIVWGGLFVDYLLKAHLLDLVSLSDGLVSSLLMSALRA